MNLMAESKIGPGAAGKTGNKMFLLLKLKEQYIPINRKYFTRSRRFYD